MKKLIAAFTLIALNAFGAAQAPYPINVPGTSLPIGHIPVGIGGLNVGDGGIPSGIGNMTGPAGAGTGNAAKFDGATGLLLKDAGAPPALAVADVATLAATPIAPFNLGYRVRVLTYASDRHAPPVDYFLTSVTCTPDGGSCIAAAGGTAFWHIVPMSIYDVRNWGAYGDLKKLILPVTTITINSCVVNVAGASFGIADIGKNISITHASSASTVVDIGYQGMIVAGSGNSVTVSTPCPQYNSSIGQNVTYGHAHADVTAFNLASNYIDSLPQNVSGLPVLSGGGLAYGADSPVHANANAEYPNYRWVAMSATGFPASSGLCSIEASYSRIENWVCDSNYLPVNGVTGTANGTILPGHVRALDWYGSTSVHTAFTGAHSVAAGVGTGVTISACTGSAANGWSCNMAVTGLTSGNIQPGYGVTGAGVPNETYVAAYGDNKAIGGAGNYRIFNSTTQPTGTSIGPITATFLGFDVVVNACNSNNFASVGLISHGNTAVGIPDRTFIAACNPATSTITLNKAPTKAFTGAAPTFHQDANGFYLPRYSDPIAMTGNVGIQFDHPTTDWDQLKGDPANQYGCSIYDNSNGGSSFFTIGSFQGAAGICRGPDAAGGTYKGGVHISNMGSSRTDINQPGVIEMDGGTGSNYENIELFGQFQRFIVTGTPKPNIQTTGLSWFGNTGTTGYAPANSVFIYTEKAGTSLADITFSSNGASLLVSTTGQPLIGAMTLISPLGAGAFAEFTPSQINIMSGSSAVTLNAAAGPTFFPGVDLGTGPLDHAELPLVTLTGAYSFTENDCGRYFRLNGTGYSVTATNGLGQNVNNPTPTACTIKFYAPAAGLSLAVGSGATVFDGGASSGGPFALAAQTTYQLDCPANPNGTLAVCYLSQPTTATGATTGVLLADIATLRANTVSWPLISISGYATAGDGGGGNFNLVSGSCSDNGGTIIVDAASHCYSRAFTGPADVRWWGAFGGASDNTAQIQAAITAAQGVYGAVKLAPTTYKIGASADLNIGNVSLVGDNSSLGYITNQGGAAYTLLLNPAHTINMGNNSRIQGVRIIRQGLTQPNSIRSAITAVSQFAGTAITITNAIEVELDHVFIAGFNLAIQQSGDRMRLNYVAGDDTNGIQETECGDTCTADHIEFWPYLSAPYALNPQFQTSAISSVSSAGGAIEITLSAVPATPIITGDTVVVSAPGVPNALGRWTATAIDSTHLTLNGSTFAGSYTSGGTVYLTANRRTGKAVEVIGQGSLWITNFIEYGFDVSWHVGATAYGNRCYECWFDGDASAAVVDPVPVGVLIDGTPTDTTMQGSFITKTGTSITNNMTGLFNQLSVMNTTIGAIGVASGVTGSGLTANGGITVIGGGSVFRDQGTNPTNPYTYITDNATSVIFTGVAPNPSFANTPTFQSGADCFKFTLDGGKFCPYLPVIYGETTHGTATYSVQGADYVSQNGAATVYFRIVLSGLGGATGNMDMTLPSTAAMHIGDGGSCSFGRLAGITATSGFTALSGSIGGGSNFMQFNQFNFTTGGLANVDAASFGSTAEIQGVCSYRE